MANTVAGVLLTGLLSARPSASAVSAGTLYAASDTGLIYQSDGVSSWTTWATLGTSGAIVNPMTTLGDIIYGSTVVGGAATPARKGIGGSNTVLHGGFIPPAYTAVVEGDFGFTDITTANASTSQHGLSPKRNGSNTYYLDGTGVYSIPAGGGGGGITHTYVGYNTVGGSWEAAGGTLNRTKTIVLATDGLLASIGAYVQNTTDNTGNMAVALFADNSGAVGTMISFETMGGLGGGVMGMKGSVGGRWIHLPVGMWLAAGTYYMAVFVSGGNLQIAYDSGSDIYYTNAGFWIDGQYQSQTTGSKSYSIRGDFLT